MVLANLRVFSLFLFIVVFLHVNTGLTLQPITVFLKKPVGGVAVMPLGTDLLSKFRKEKIKEEGTAHNPVADVSINIQKIS